MTAPAMAEVFEHPAVSRQRLRVRLAALIDRLITMLDDLEADPDLEDAGDDEPSLSAGNPVETWQGNQTAWLEGGDADCEVSCEDEGAEHDGREPEEDDDKSDFEASLCGISFGVCGCSGEDREATSAPFTFDQSQGS